MLRPRLDRTGLCNPHAWGWIRGSLVGCLGLLTVGLAGCDPGPERERCRNATLMDPDICPRPEFRVNVDHGPGPGPGPCEVNLTASTVGGDEDTYAMWGELVARVFDPVTQQFRAWPHPWGESSDVFGADRIKKGEMQSGDIDLEWFRLYEDQAVWVQLEVRYTVVDGGAPAESDKTIRFDLECR